MKKGRKAPTSGGGAAVLPLKKLREPVEVKAVGRLFIGSQRSSANVDYLQKSLHITHVLSIGVDTLHPNAFRHKRIKGLQDSPTADLPLLASCIEFIDDALCTGSGVLVHCQGGVSRSAAVVVAYLLHRNPHLSVDEALALLRQCRPNARPRPEFLAQLHTFRERSAILPSSPAPALATFRQQDVGEDPTN